jgi:subfamily B ATP-binding cassette protein MsbA
MKRFRRLLDFLRPYTGALGLTLFAAVVASILDGFTFALLIPFLRLLFGATSAFATEAPTAVERVLDGVVGFALTADRVTALRNVVLIILATFVVKNVAVYVAASRSAFIQEGVARDLRCALYGHIQKLGLEFFQRMKGGQLVSRMIADTEQARLVVSATLVSAIQNILLVVVYLIVLAFLSWRLTLITLLIAPSIALFMRPILGRIRSRMSQALHDRGEVTAILSETVEGAKLVKAHAAEGYERRRFEAVVSRYFTAVVKTQRLAVLAHPVSETLGVAVVLLLLVIVTGSGVGGTDGMRPELFLPFMAVTLRLLSPVKALSQFPVNVELSLSAAERVFEILDKVPDDVDVKDVRPFPGLKRDIVFKDVSFAHEPGMWALTEVNLTVRAGEVAAIVGPSGAGKSTLVDLLPRFYDPQRGAVLLDDVPITDYSRGSLRRAMGVVSQHTVLFNDTVRANIAYGDLANASLEAVEAAARAANAATFIERLPNGYDTVLGERGMRLSGGERQRIALARVLLKDPPILILDEATSALDAESERLVQDAIARLLENRTVLVIAHRLSTVARADQIAVLEAGRLVELGNHTELVKAGGVYQRLHSLEMVTNSG